MVLSRRTASVQGGKSKCRWLIRPTQPPQVPPTSSRRPGTKHRRPSSEVMLPAKTYCRPKHSELSCPQLLYFAGGEAGCMYLGLLVHAPDSCIPYPFPFIPYPCAQDEPALSHRKNLPIESTNVSNTNVSTYESTYDRETRTECFSGHHCLLCSELFSYGAVFSSVAHIFLIIRSFPKHQDTSGTLTRW